MFLSCNIINMLSRKNQRMFFHIRKNMSQKYESNRRSTEYKYIITQMCDLYVSIYIQEFVVIAIINYILNSIVHSGLRYYFYYLLIINLTR